MKGSAITENLATLEQLEGDSTRSWQMRLGHVGLDSLKALTK